MTDLTGVMKWMHHASKAGKLFKGSVAFDWAVVLFGLWMVGGLHLDAWAHHQFDLESFFSPWHAVLYTGYLFLAGIFLGAFIQNLRRGATWGAAMPVGYGLSLFGTGIFMAGGVGDMLWHTLFGIEVGVEALLSPTHLVLALGGGLMVSGPLRAAWSRPGDISRSWIGFAPALLSLAMLLAVFSFFTVYASPLADAILSIGHSPASGLLLYFHQGLGISAILLQSAIMMGVILLVVRRWRVPTGGLSMILMVAYGLTVSIHEDYFFIPFIFLAGLAADVLYKWLKPSVERATELRWFAFGVPVVFYALYFLTLALTSGVWWTIHLWTGAILLSGITGWLLSYAFVPPQIPVEQGI